MVGCTVYKCKSGHKPEGEKFQTFRFQEGALGKKMDPTNKHRKL